MKVAQLWNMTAGLRIVKYRRLEESFGQWCAEDKRVQPLSLGGILVKGSKF